ncbi:Cytosolic sulfotransferase 5 [Platanthera guangdongensis]|uniref:Sulfotransferase n=1 Tax=Platanthera guangdongensis TaxID=2320717 RepID=A0ABR2LHK4_9ASPA
MKLSKVSVEEDERNKRQAFIDTPNFFLHNHKLCNYKGFWLPENVVTNVELLRDGFTPRPTDVFIASHPKCGTTWLKGLAFAALNRTNYSPLTSTPHPLLTLNPHECVPFLEVTLQGMNLSYVESMSSPRLLSFHLPPSMLPTSINDAFSNCRIIYVCRETKDVFTSSWHFYQTLMESVGMKSPLSDDFFESFCGGRVPYGPIWEHVLEYWRESQQKPGKVLFLRYEEMIEDPRRILKMIAQFMGCEFSKEEENMGLVDKLVELCGFNRLSNIEENKNELIINENIKIKKSLYFRKGLVGDWANLLTPEMAQRLDEITREKFNGSGLNF